MKSNTLCTVPWMHLNFEPNGKVVPCCLTSSYQYFAGDLTTQTVDEIWNSENMKTLRREMIAGVEPKICSKCFDQERVTGESGRVFQNEEFEEVLDKIPDITLEDGTCTEMKLKYWDFRFSNLCNFKCRSCGPRYSSAWVPDAKKLGYTDQEKVWNIESVDNKTNFDFLKEQVHNVEKIYFAGGEPLMMDEHWQILDMLVEAERFDVRIQYNTNCSLLTYGKKNVLDYWRQWEPGKIEVWPSIDEIGLRAELIRSGTVWPKVKENLIELSKLDNIRIKPGITTGAMNVFRLPEIIMTMVNLGIISEKHGYKNFFINLLEDPKHYHVHILSARFRKAIVKKLTEFMVTYKQRYNADISKHLEYIMHELEKPYSYRSAVRFTEITTSVDEIRNEDMYNIIPEMRDVLQSVKEYKKNE
jgi:hypothetical protein